MLLCVLIIIMEMEKIFISPTDFKESTKAVFREISSVYMRLKKSK